MTSFWILFLGGIGFRSKSECKEMSKFPAKRNYRSWRSSSLKFHLSPIQRAEMGYRARAGSEHRVEFHPPLSSYGTDYAWGTDQLSKKVLTFK